MPAEYTDSEAIKYIFKNMQIQASDPIARSVLMEDTLRKIKNNSKLAKAFYAAMLAVDEKKSKCGFEDIEKKYIALGNVPKGYEGKEATYFLKSTTEFVKKKQNADKFGSKILHFFGI